jgi:hypothetical protein
MFRVHTTHGSKSSPLQDYWSASTLTKQALPKKFTLLNSSVFLVFFTKQKVSETRDFADWTIMPET